MAILLRPTVHPAAGEHTVCHAKRKDAAMARALVVLNPGSEEIETMSVADILVRAGQEVCVAGSDGLSPLGSRNLPMRAERLLADVVHEAWDVVYIPGGLGSADFASANPAVQDLVESQLNSDRLLAIICAAPICLIPRGLCAGRTLTCYPGKRPELEAAGATWVDEPVVFDGNLITSQGPGTAMTLGFELAARLSGDVENVKTVADAMLTTWTPAA
jgi:DJ-1 family protein